MKRSRFKKRNYLDALLLVLLIIGLEITKSCAPMEEPEDMNTAPQASGSLENLNLQTGFSSTTVDISNVFTDKDGDPLTYKVESSDDKVVTVSVSGTTITIKEVGEGSSTITVTADDDLNGTASLNFTVTVGSSETVEGAPTVVKAISDMTLASGFGTTTVSLPEVFSDDESPQLSFTASSSNESVVTVSIMGPSLEIKEAGEGTATVTITAKDDDGNTVSDEFTVTVSADGSGSSDCSSDNSIDTSRTDCDVTPSSSNEVTITENEMADTRTVVSNNMPDHLIGSFINSDVTAQDFSFTLDLTPEVAAEVTNLLNTDPDYAMVTSAYEFGVALNGVKFDPVPNEPWENPETGERNYQWNLEPTNVEIGLDCNEAHVQPTGAYHYHGVPSLFFDQLGVSSSAMVLVGWAGDGFPVYGKYGYQDASDNTSQIVELQPSYRLKEGERSGDGTSEPCGEYNGRYTNDYEYVEGLGDLDECNGRTGVTPEFPEGTYYYVITSSFPKQPRCWKGSPNSDFKVF